MHYIKNKEGFYYTRNIDGGERGCPIFIDQKDGATTFEIKYYALYHIRTANDFRNVNHNEYEKLIVEE